MKVPQSITTYRIVTVTIALLFLFLVTLSLVLGSVNA